MANSEDALKQERELLAQTQEQEKQLRQLQATVTEITKKLDKRNSK